MEILAFPHAILRTRQILKNAAKDGQNDHFRGGKSEKEATQSL
jgi:hypothetical protein